MSEAIKLGSWEAGKLKEKPFMPFLASYRSSLQASSPWLPWLTA
jgi:hypothetical protein